MKLNKKQIEAIENSDSPFSVITGGAGTGKTTIIKEIVRNVRNISDSIPALVCPTGKAAARLREASGITTSTIHSLMKYNFNTGTFMINDLSPYTLIIDESSMMDSWLFSSIINRKPHRICLVGDFAQLPPVGVGSPFHDIVEYYPEFVTTLDICYRNTEAIFKAATAIRDFSIPLSYDKTINEEWVMANTGNAEQTEEKLLEIVKKGIIDFEQDIILVTRNGSEDTPCTRASLNKKIADILLPRDEKTKFVVGDRGICEKNFSGCDMWNGTTFTVTGLDKSGALYIRGDIPFCINGQEMDEQKLPKEVEKECKLAYALTVHKSQGSQYRNVIFCCMAADSYMMLYNSLIYTAVTRAKKICYVMGDSASFFNGVLKKREKRTIIDLLALTENKKLEAMRKSR